jgi:aminoglycoside phosphotransferase (APT) family kinase protein
VLKLYADDSVFRTAAAALLVGLRLPVVTPPRTGACARSRLTAQPALDGQPLADGAAAARDAGALLADLHRGHVRAWRRHLDPLAGATASAATLAHLLPEMQPRLEHLVARLAANAPAPGGSLCHGDYHAAQLLVTPAGLAVLDLDELGIGAPTIDLATYAAHLLDGSKTGTDRLDEALDDLVTGYGARPPDLAWHTAVAVLRRAVFPFRKDLTYDWPQRVETMIGAAETALRP